MFGGLFNGCGEGGELFLLGGVVGKLFDVLIYM